MKGEHLPDVIELGEVRAEAWAENNVRGDEFLCAGCDEWAPIADACQATNDPYSPPICGRCVALEMDRLAAMKTPRQSGP